MTNTVKRTKETDQTQELPVKPAKKPRNNTFKPDLLDLFRREFAGKSKNHTDSYGQLARRMGVPVRRMYIHAPDLKRINEEAWANKSNGSEPVATKMPKLRYTRRTKNVQLTEKPQVESPAALASAAALLSFEIAALKSKLARLESALACLE